MADENNQEVKSSGGGKGLIIVLIALVVFLLLAVVGVLRGSELEFLFGKEQAVKIKSAAVVTLEHNGVHGVLAVGSDDQQHYSNSVDTLFLSYLADVLARLLPTMLASLRSVK